MKDFFMKRASVSSLKFKVFMKEHQNIIKTRKSIFYEAKRRASDFAIIFNIIVKKTQFDR